MKLITSISIFLLHFSLLSQTTVWQNNFSTPSTWVVNNSGQTGAQFGWSIDATRDGWWAPSTAIASTSGGNYAELTNGNPTLSPGTQALDVTYTMTTALPISLATSGTQVSLEFLQFGARFNDLQEIQISTNGTTFVPVGNNNNFPILSASGGSAYPNPSTKIINLAPYLNGATQVWIRFSWTTNYPSAATNPNVWITYGWYIDDVKIKTNPNYDLSIQNESWGSNGLKYYQIPKAQVQPISFNSKILNEGQQTMTNVSLQINVNAGSYTNSSTSTSIPSLSSDSLWVNYTPPNNVNATYTINRSINSQQIDQNPANNLFQTITIAVNDNIYARDNGIIAGSTSNGANGFELGNLYKIYQNQTIAGIRVRIASGTAIGTPIYVSLYSVDPISGDFVNVSNSNTLLVTASNVNSYLTIPLISPYLMQANNTYLAVVGSSTQGLKISNAGISEISTSYFTDYSGNWFYVASTPVVQMLMCSNVVTTQVINQIACNSYVSQLGQTYSQSGTYTETIPNSTGCDSIIVTINLTIINPISTNFSTSICAGGTYNWNNQVYTLPGTYSQTFQVANGCDSIVTLNLSVNVNNPIQIQPNPAFGNAPLNVAFNNQTSNLTNYNFTWYFGDGTSQQSNSPFLSHIYTQDSYADVTVVAENITTGCESSNTFNDMIFVIGGIVCTHTASINQTGPLSTCTGDSILLSCNTSPTFTYQWNRNGVPVFGATNSSIYAFQSGNYTVTIYQNNCPVTSSSISITINPLPATPTITSTGSISSCSGGTLTLFAPSGFNSYSWNTGATNQNITVSQSGNYSVSVTNSNGCTKTSNPFSVNASFMQTPNICIVGVDSLTNKNRVVWEKPISSGIDSFYIYKESNVSNIYSKIGATNYSDLAVFLDQNSNPAIQAYRYKLAILDTCGTLTNLGDFHKTIHLTINQGIGGAWNLIWSHYEGISFGSYNIYRGTSPNNMSLLTTIQSNLNSYTDLAAPAGSVYYQIEIINPTNCNPNKSVNYSSAKSNIVNNGQNSIEGLSNDNITIYPNPTSNFITVNVTEGLINQMYSIYDYSGRIIKQANIQKSTEQIDLSAFSTGIYYFKIENKNIQKMLVKQ